MLYITISAGISAAATENAMAKVEKRTPRLAFQTGKLRTATIILSMITATDPDPMDWQELDSLSSKPPRKERRPRKAPYKKPEAVLELEQVTGDKHRDDTANGLTRCIIAYILSKGGQAERINSMGIPIDTRQQVTDIMGHHRTIGSMRWRRSGSTRGSADISATIRGLSVKIEVKVGKDRQSNAQRLYQASVEQAGGLYYVAHDLTSFVKWYRQNFSEKGGLK